MNQTDIDLQIAVPPQTRYLSLIGNIAELLVHEIKEYAGDRDLLGYHLNLVLTEAMANVIQHTALSEQGNTLRVHIHPRAIQPYSLGFFSPHGKRVGWNAVTVPPSLATRVP